MIGFSPSTMSLESKHFLRPLVKSNGSITEQFTAGQPIIGA